MSTIERAREFCKSKEVSTVDANNYADFANAEVEGYRAALKELVEAVTASDKDSIGYFQFCQVHDMPYKGRQHGEALARANALLLKE